MPCGTQPEPPGVLLEARWLCKHWGWGQALKGHQVQERGCFWAPSQLLREGGSLGPQRPQQASQQQATAGSHDLLLRPGLLHPHPQCT